MSKSGMAMGLSFLLALALCPAERANGQTQGSRVEKNAFISPDNPKMHVTVDRKFKYVGSVPFVIENAAAGNRYVFVKANANKHIERMFLIQQEGFLPSSDDTYKYPITNPVKLGGFEYRHSVFMYNNDAGIREELGKEGDLTKRFLEAHGYTLEAELVMPRFARPADSQHKHEIIFFCYENLSAYGHKLTDFPEGSDSPGKQSILNKADQNCRDSFQVIDN